MKKSAYWPVFVLYVLGVLLLTTVISFEFVPLEHGVVRRFLGDIAHFVLLGGFAFLVLLGLNIQKRGIVSWSKGSYWSAFFYASVFGVFVEFLQTFTSARSARLHDIAVNTLGIVFALAAIYFCASKKGCRPR